MAADSRRESKSTEPQSEGVDVILKVIGEVLERFEKKEFANNRV